MARKLAIGPVRYGYWGPNLSEQLVNALCGYPSVQGTEKADALFGAPEVDATLIATPVPVHYARPEQAVLTGSDKGCPALAKAGELGPGAGSGAEIGGMAQ